MIRNFRIALRNKLLDLLYRVNLLLVGSTPRSDGRRVLVLPGADGWEGGAPFSFGDEMLAVGLFGGLKEAGFEGADVLCLATEGQKKVDVYEYPVQIIGLIGGWLSLSSYSQIRIMAKKYSHFVVIGADVLDGAYSEINSTQRLRFLNILAKCGLKTVVTGFSFNGSDNAEIRSLFQDAERRGAAIYARERESLVRLNSFLERPLQAADLAFKVHIDEFLVRDHIKLLIEKIRIARSKGVFVIAVNICGWHIKDKKQFYAEFASSLDRACPFENIAIVLIPHDTRDEVGSDLNALLELRDYLDGLAPIIGGPEDVTSGIDAKLVVGACDVLITGRMHLAIAALHQGVPAVSFSYQGKFEGLYDLFKLPRSLMVDYADPVAAVEVLYDVARNREKFTNQILAALPTVQRLADENFKLI